MNAGAVDWAGTLHAPAGGEARVVSLVPSLTELLFALGLGAQVVARTGFCVHPRDAVRRVPKIGGTKDPDLAALRALEPTHLIVNVDENRREVVDAARAFVPHVIVTHPNAPEDNRRLYALFGALFGREREAAALEAELDAALAELAAVAAARPRESVLYLIWRRPWMTVALGTYIAATLARAGWDTLPAGDQGQTPSAASTSRGMGSVPFRYPVVTDNDSAWREADRILLSTEPYAFRDRDVQSIRASTGKPVHLIDGEWTSWYGSRAVPGLRALAAFRKAPDRRAPRRSATSLDPT